MRSTDVSAEGNGANNYLRTLAKHSSDHLDVCREVPEEGLDDDYDSSGAKFGFTSLPAFHELVEHAQLPIPSPLFTALPPHQYKTSLCCFSLPLLREMHTPAAEKEYTHAYSTTSSGCKHDDALCGRRTAVLDSRHEGVLWGGEGVPQCSAPVSSTEL